MTKIDKGEGGKKGGKKTLKGLFPVVGIGASAGGLEAATLLLKALPADLGMGFVLVQHLDPNHESILAKLLSKATTMKVEEAKDETRVLPNQVYVIPHDKDMTIEAGVLKLTTRDKDDKLHLPIDYFLRSLAKSHGDKAIGIILSGTASDGTLGLKAIKGKGGITFAQDESAKYQGMPKAAVDSGSVDFVLSPSGMAKELKRINGHPYIKQSKSLDKQEEVSGDEDGLTKIFSMLRKSNGIDFRHYKEATINRRIRRRMVLHKLETLEEYVKYLEDNKDEIEALQDDLLINVSSFFREPKTFEYLSDKIFPRIAKDKSSKEPIRIWVPGCATGEEVYSIAILLSEYLADNSLEMPVQIFGTDISKTAIEKARSGTYTQNDVSIIPTKRLERYFEKVDGVYHIGKPIRELCVFALHNVFGDPPFSKLDLVSCCNLMIYLDVSLQEKIFRAFHYALKSGGFLMLGKSEAVGSSSGLFSQVDKKHKIYIRKDSATREIGNFGAMITKPEKEDSVSLDVENENVMDSVDIQKDVDKILLSQYTPASVVINNDLEIIQFRGSTGAYLEPSPGKPSFNLIKMARGGLGFEIRSAISKVRKSGSSFRKENIPAKRSEDAKYVSIEVLPVKTSLEPHYLVLFEDAGDSQQTEDLPSNDKKNRTTGASERRVEDLEQELAQAREDMRSVTEEQEATNEELQTANEEILSSNEELQSINEELETSKEELESTNEELITVNEELQNRNEELVEARDYAEAIIRTVQVPLLILDRDLRVKTANRSFFKMFQVSEKSTKGSFIYDLGNGQWDIPALHKLLNEILPENNSFDNYEIEHTFPVIGHKIMLLNARKFHKDGENILLAIEDISDRKEIEKQKDLFIGIASHELKTPITTMKAYAQMLEKRFADREDSKDYYLIDNINKQTDRLTNLINDLLNTSRIKAGKLELEKEKFDLDKVVAKEVDDFQFSTETHQIIVEGEVKEKVYGDKSRIEEVLTNLLSNAIKYSPESDRVIVGLENDGENAIVSVQDFGYGIDIGDQPKVFERFYRTIDKQEMNVSGFGLGLYIAAEIVKAHGGRIWLESAKGTGSTFYFRLPLSSMSREQEVRGKR